MKIGIVSSGNDTLALRKILTKYDHEYLIYHDQTFFPFGGKDFEFILKELQKAVQYLVKQGVETVIIDPVYELAL
jgi:glutamate racemase